MAVERHDHGERLRRGHHAPDCVHRKLLHHAVDRRGERLELGSLLGLDHVLGKAGGLLFGLGQLVKTGAAILRRSLGAGFGQRGNRGVGFAVVALLNQEFLLLGDEILVLGQIRELRTQFLVEEVFTNINPLRQDRNRRLELGDGGRSGGALGLLLRYLPIDRGELGLLFGRLADQELAVHLDQRRARVLGRAEVLKWIGVST